MHANLDIEIKITERDIVSGAPNCVGSCPLALALKREIDYKLVIQVFRTVVRIDNAEYYLNATGQHFVSKFDNKHTAEPTTVQLIRKN